MSKIPPVLMHAASFATCAGEFMVERTPPHLYPGERALLGLVLPPFQRPAVWDVSRQRQFIESLFLGLNSTAIVVTDNEWHDDGRRLPKTSWIIDGQQRLTALAAFLAGELAIFDNVRFADLDAADRRRLDHAPLARIKVSYRTSEADLKTLYERLAFGGLAHSEDDRRHLHSN
jgi:hypothetical protein